MHSHDRSGAIGGGFGRVINSITVGLLLVVVMAASVWWFSTRGRATVSVLDESMVFSQCGVGKTGGGQTGQVSAEQQAQIRAILAATPAEMVSSSGPSPLAFLSNIYRARTVPLQQFSTPQSHWISITLEDGRIISVSVWETLGEALVVNFTKANGVAQGVYRMQFGEKADALVNLLDRCCTSDQRAEDTPDDEAQTNAMPQGADE